MTIIKTQRMGFIKESDDELIDPFAPNWTLADSLAGALSVPNGTTPDPATLFHGSIVAEATSGISWIADKSSGSLVKRYLTYPWTASAGTNGNQSFVSDTANRPVQFIVTDPPVCPPTVNWDKVLTNYQIKVPIDAVYSITATLRSSMSPGLGSRSMTIGFNGAPYTGQAEMSDTSLPGGWTFLQISFIAALSANDLIGLSTWQNSGSTINSDYTMNVELVCPR